MRLTRLVGPSCVALCSWSAHACTLCDSRNGQQLRAGLFDGHFLSTLLFIAAPVPVFVGAVMILHLAMPDLSEDLGGPGTTLASLNDLSASESVA